MRGLRIALLTISLIAAFHPSSQACLWDYDTLAMERERFPEAIELITGKFLRHSPEFYKWRIQDREARLAEGESTPELYDDLAVAYEKLGNHQKAIEIITKKDKHFPGLYETHANLGTFSIHAGELERGIQEIERAIAINPDAHFGREIYQKLLVEYVLSKHQDGKTKLPLDDNPSNGFADFVLKQQGIAHDYDKHEEELKKALKGVLGMMRFGNHESPVLLEALANLLLLGSEDTDAAKRLAACAYLKASYETKDEATRKTYRKLAEQVLFLQTKDLDSLDRLTLDELEEVFLKQLAEAKEWYAELEADEKAWIEAGKNPEEEFAIKYADEPALSTTFDGGKPSRLHEMFGLSPYDRIIAGLGLVAVIVAILVGLYCIRWMRRKKTSLSSSILEPSSSKHD